MLSSVTWMRMKSQKCHSIYLIPNVKRRRGEKKVHKIHFWNTSSHISVSVMSWSWQKWMDVHLRHGIISWQIWIVTYFYEILFLIIFIISLTSDKIYVCIKVCEKPIRNTIFIYLTFSVCQQVCNFEKENYEIFFK